MWRRLLLWSDHLRHRLRWQAWPRHLALGREGEDLAHRYLQTKGYRIVSRNYRTASGFAEIDLIARDGPTLVFVEVKTRESGEFGAPERNIDRDKRYKIISGARDYVRRSGHDVLQTRVDIVSVLLGPEVTQIHHFNDVFSVKDAL